MSRTRISDVLRCREIKEDQSTTNTYISLIERDIYKVFQLCLINYSLLWIVIWHTSIKSKLMTMSKRFKTLNLLELKKTKGSSNAKGMIVFFTNLHHFFIVLEGSKKPER